MRMRARFLGFAFLCLFVIQNPPSAKAAPADDVVAAALAKWSDAFAHKDWDAIAGLYSADALFFGSSPPLYKGIDGVKAYFNALPPLQDPKATFTDLVVVPVGANVINVAGTATFIVSPAAPPMVFRLTQVFVNDNGIWKIVSHHVSRKMP